MALYLEFLGTDRVGFEFSREEDIGDIFQTERFILWLSMVSKRCTCDT